MIIRVQKKLRPYVLLDKGFLRDHKLSWKAKGLLAYLLSHPDDWKVMMEDLTKRATDGEHAVRSAMAELRELGYAKMEAVRDKTTGRLLGRSITIFESPEAAEGLVFRNSENPNFGKPRTTNNKGILRTNSRAAERPGERDGLLGLKKKESPPVQDLAVSFSQLSIKQRWHVGKKGSTLSGWSPEVIKHWTRCLQKLVSQTSLEDVSSMIEWYKRHHQEPFVPQVRTVPGFVEKFSEIVAASKRIGGVVSSSTKYEVEHGGTGEIPEE